jgi:hypothetical protein
VAGRRTNFTVNLRKKVFRILNSASVASDVELSSQPEIKLELVVSCGQGLTGLFELLSSHAVPLASMMLSVV